MNRYNIARMLATWFGSGLSPKAPGTVGTLAALPFAYALHVSAGGLGLFCVAWILFLIGIPVCHVYLAHTGKEDPGEIVIDEVAGVCLLLSVLPPTWQGYFVGFALFRLFDVLKPWPICWADRAIKGAVGVMFDDMLAAFYPIIFIGVCLGITLLLGIPDVFTPFTNWLMSIA